MTTTLGSYGSGGNSKNILVGAAALFVGPSVNPQIPAFEAGYSFRDTVASAILAGGGTTALQEVGFSENGVNVSYQPTYGDVVVDQLLDSALVFKSSMKVEVTTTFAEATLENLILTWGQLETTKTTDANGDVLSIEGGSLGDRPHERTLVFVGQAPAATVGSSERVYTVSRAIQTATSAHDLKRDAATTLPATFRCLPGSVDSNGNTSGTAYGTVRDRNFTVGS